MKNAIKYYYNLNIQELHKTKNDFSFICQNQKYILYNVKISPEKINDIINLYGYITSLGLLCHKIVSNNKNKIITNINNQTYCLIRIVIPTRIINIEDIKYYMKAQVNINEFEMIKRNDWKKLWIKKIDFIEYHSKKTGKKNNFPQEYIDYYTGIIEICIAMLNEIKNNRKNMTINHNRVNKKMTTDEFYNPLTFIIDIRIRDLCEYIKSNQFKSMEIINIIEKINLTTDEFIFFFIRLMYPSVFLDCYETTVSKNIEKNHFLRNPSNVDNELKRIKYVYNYIKKLYQMPEIGWLNDD